MRELADALSGSRCSGDRSRARPPGRGPLAWREYVRMHGTAGGRVLKTRAHDLYLLDSFRGHAAQLLSWIEFRWWPTLSEEEMESSPAGVFKGLRADAAVNI